jgi:hypothetical protein
VSIYPDNGENLTTLLPHADTAMYRVKARNKQERMARSKLTPAPESGLGKALALRLNF